jgi:hypothetical protein
MRRETLASLSSYAKDGELNPELQNLFDLVDGESDRGAVVIIGSVLEDFLLNRILSKLRPLGASDVKNLIRSGGLVSTFADKVTLAHALDLIDDDLVEMLDVVKAMRNACAHSRRDIGFTNPVLQNALLLLFENRNVEELKGSTDRNFMRYAFVVSTGYLLLRLTGMEQAAADKMVQILVNSANRELQKELAKVSASQRKQTARSEKLDHPDPKG